MKAFPVEIRLWQGRTFFSRSCLATRKATRAVSLSAVDDIAAGWLEQRKQLFDFCERRRLRGLITERVGGVGNATQRLERRAQEPLGVRHAGACSRTLRRMRYTS